MNLMDLMMIFIVIFRWIMYVENLILETDHKLMIYHESLKRLRRHVEIIQQIHIAPAMYLSAVAEVVRRRAFSQAFLMVNIKTHRIIKTLLILFPVGVRVGVSYLNNSQ